MSYKDDYKKAKDAGEIQPISATFHEWKKKGDLVVGQFMHVNQVAGRQPNTFYNQYLFMTDEGLIKFSLGGVTDNESGVMMRIGEVYAIEFLGKEDIGHNQSVNRFNVERLTSPGATRVGGPSDETF